MGLVKNIEQIEPVTVTPDAQPVDGVATHEWEGVPVDLWRYYGVHLEDSKPEQATHLKEICEIVSDELTEKTIGNIMDYLSKLDIKLGATPIGENRLNQVWGYLKLQANIKEMQKRQRAYER